VNRTQPNGEQFYVLENDLQQIVFSNLGGAIAQINLSFKDEEHQKALSSHWIRQTLARILLKMIHFRVPYASYGETMLHQPLNRQSVLLPLLRRPIFSATHEILSKPTPRYYALNTFIDAEG